MSYSLIDDFITREPFDALPTKALISLTVIPACSAAQLVIVTRCDGHIASKANEICLNTEHVDKVLTSSLVAASQSVTCDVW